MTRELTAGFIAEATAGSLTPVFLIAAHFDSGDLNFWSGTGDLIYAGATYIGVLPILGMDSIQEKSDIQATGINISMSGLAPSILAIARDEPYQQRPIEVSVAVLDQVNAVIADPYQFFGGYMDVMTYQDDAKSVTIQVAAESELIALERALDTNYTPEDQAREFEGDTGFNFVADIQNRKVVWG